MAEYVMVVQSQALPGRDDEYNDWYDNQHFHDILAIPGVKDGARYDSPVAMFGVPGLKYLAVYNLDIETPEAFMAEMGRRVAEGLMPMTEAIDSAASQLWIYRQNGAKA